MPSAPPHRRRRIAAVTAPVRIADRTRRRAGRGARSRGRRDRRARLLRGPAPLGERRAVLAGRVGHRTARAAAGPGARLDGARKDRRLLVGGFAAAVDTLRQAVRPAGGWCVVPLSRQVNRHGWRSPQMVARYASAVAVENGAVARAKPRLATARPVHAAGRPPQANEKGPARRKQIQSDPADESKPSRPRGTTTQHDETRSPCRHRLPLSDELALQVVDRRPHLVSVPSGPVVAGG